MKEIAVSKITITIGDTEVQLSVEDAHQLRDALDQLLGTKANITINPPSQNRWPRQWYENPLFKGLSYDITCASTTKGVEE